MKKLAIAVVIGTTVGVAGCDGVFGQGNKPDCGSEKGRTFIVTGMKKKPPQDLLEAAASNRNDEVQSAFLKSDREKGNQETTCASKASEGMNREYARIGHPERRISAYDVRQGDLCALPIELTSTENQCKQFSDTIWESYQSCIRSEGAETAAFHTLQRERQSAFDRVSFSLEDIRMSSRNKDTGAVVCLANLRASLPSPWGSATMPITYKIEMTADHKNYYTVNRQ